MKVISSIRLSKFRSPIPIIILIVICLNLWIAPVVYANTGGSLDRISALAIAVLGFTTLMLVVYLLIVMFQPERF